MAEYSKYINGSAVRKLDTKPARRRDQYNDDRRERKVQRAVNIRRKVNTLYAGIVILAIAACFYLCVSYVMVYSNIGTVSNNIIDMEKKIELLKVANEVAYDEVDSSIDLKYVYKRATQKLGMVPAARNQVYQYDNKKSDRVIQYKDIPE